MTRNLRTRTRNRARGEALARRMASGTVLVNDVCEYGISEAPHTAM